MQLCMLYTYKLNSTILFAKGSGSCFKDWFAKIWRIQYFTSPETAHLKSWRVWEHSKGIDLVLNCQALVPNPSPQSHQAQSQPSPAQLKTQIDRKGTGAYTKIL